MLPTWLLAVGAVPVLHPLHRLDSVLDLKVGRVELEPTGDRPRGPWLRPLPHMSSWCFLPLPRSVCATRKTRLRVTHPVGSLRTHAYGPNYLTFVSMCPNSSRHRHAAASTSSHPGFCAVVVALLLRLLEALFGGDQAAFLRVKSTFLSKGT
ncbi:hypothetical protein FB45DRAFT_999343 [Roridomyces roridus]|uniref:Uncharacterized protein n=1 Tax=Roridomyces roridus TaxID=1738132 RepID=A0AAD7FUS1_9AGAR|nr:hypothetical protein FB45DRAFT_999343 [Roridomyces roridus]